VREGLEAVLKSRAAYLERGIRELLHDRDGWGLAHSVYQHPVVYALYADEYRPGGGNGTRLLARGGKLPSYIPAANFATALLDIAARGPNPTSDSGPDAPRLTAETIRANILNVANEPVQRVLLNALDAAQGDLDQARRHLQAWYDSAMDRVSGWYKRSTQWIVFWIGLGFAVAMNVNTLAIGDHLYRNDAAREAIVARAVAAAADTTVLSADYAQAREALDSLGLPIGWTGGLTRMGWTGGPGALRWGGAWSSLFGPLLGWLITALAATMGAPFWFDMLNKFSVVRSTVKPHEKSPEEASEDRQPRGRIRAEVVTAPADVVAAVEATAPVAVVPPLAAEPTESPPEDGCDVPITRATRDEDLPPARGGVA
jgi:hypothetical protein